MKRTDFAYELPPERIAQEPRERGRSRMMVVTPRADAAPVIEHHTFDYFPRLLTPDDVLVGRGGHIFVNTLGDNAIHELDSQGHQVGVITGIQQPQGIALDDADNLYYTEFNTGRIDRVVRSFILDPAKVTRTARGTYVICPVIRRASGFTGRLGLQTGSSTKTAILQLVQPGTDSSGALEVETTEASIGITVSDGGLLSQSQTVSLSP